MLSRQQRFLKYIMQTSEEPVLLDVERANGVYLYDQDGSEIIDIISGIGVSSYGHNNPAIVQAIKDQSDKYLHTMVYGEFVQTPQIELAQKITELTSENLDSVYFVNSGSEAIEGAMKLAKRFTGRAEFVAMKSAYHGSTHGSLSLMSDQYFSNKFRPLVPGVRFMDFNSIDQLEKINENVAAVFVEPIQGEAGYIPANKEFLTDLRSRCDEVGALLVFDEIQTGMGRSGTVFAYEQYGVEPDILCLAKAFGAGMPLGAFISSQKIGSVLQKDPVLGHITTFGGHPVSCAAALAGVNQLLDNDLLDEIDAKEQLFRQLLKHPNIKSITGTGLMLGVELPNEPFLKKVVHRCLENGVMIDWFLYADHKLRIAPPLIISIAEIEKACEIILEAIDYAS